MIYIVCLFLAAAAFFITTYALNAFRYIETEGKIQKGLDNNKSKTTLSGLIIKHAIVLGLKLANIKNKKFVEFAQKLDKDIKFCGNAYKNLNGYSFISLQFFSFAAGAFFCLVFISSDFLVMFILGIFASFLPLLKLKEDVKKRKEEMLKQLPDIADLLSVTLAGGGDFIGALSKVCAILKGALSDEFKSAVSKMALGYNKKDALSEISSKCELEPLDSFIRTVNMSFDSGAPMADTLQRLSVQMHQERASAAEKKAHEAPIKILIPLILFIFPTIFIVIFGPIAINFFTSGGF